MFLHDQIRQLDIYKRLPKDLTEPTLLGAIVSIVSTLILLFLFISELSDYIDPNIHSSMYLDRSVRG